MKALVSGASIAGPVLAYWLARHGIDVTVVERAPALRKTGGHAIDLFRPAMEIADRMGVLPEVMARATGTTRLSLYQPGTSRPTSVDYVKLVGTMSDRHVEIMRDDLSEIFYAAGRDDAEYLFGDQITAITDDGHVEFQHGPARHFDIIVGADGLHSGVRQLAFGKVTEHFLGGYLAVVSVPKSLAVDGVMTGYYAPGQVALLYTADHLDDARGVFIFRTLHTPAFHYDHRDVAAQKNQLRQAFAGTSAEVDTWLAEVEHTPAFYFDAITQLEMPTWSRGRVTLVGDAGYCPGPAVGGSTSLAVYGAYMLADALAKAHGDHVAAFAAYERNMAAPVAGARKLARVNAKTVVPGSRLGVRALLGLAQLITVLPLGVTQSLARLNSKGVRLYDTMPLPD
ncbi:FAD-dependent oxidoreductase [Mycolicibacterium cosmeticum]|uniref:Oxidoreductase n=1 Tax=Mycolicibacterium cosmeticum TaxID=258533 RepID=W9BJU9_MYCCO|nr:FAD-dependent monooxygenase [Mycolicibacterium cosmeticum]TLH80078.1 FAD-dependent oxidoreductase [Mycolicibacterium cosmeticum]CDO07230.1 oxidoreductase [Mycolicibacterium cosmeticum]